MKNKIVFIFVLFLLFSFSFKNVFASELCSSNGYTILTINGIFTDEDGALENRDNLREHFLPTYNNQPLKIDYVYNPTRLLGAADLVDVLAQMIIDQNDDYDMVEILNDASQKVTTQKLLLVGHSQGNFYANNLYDAVASQPGGVPSQSIGVYGVASPATRVAGGGKYVTSSSDTVINSLAAKLVNNNILPPNVNMPLQGITDGSNGHGFSETYLKYQSNRIVSDIKYSLDKLQNNDEQLPEDPCISPPELTFLHKAWGVGLAYADFVLNDVSQGSFVTDGTYKMAVAIGNFFHNTGLAVGNALSGLFSNALDSVGDVASVTTLPTNIIREDTEETSPSTSPIEEQTPTTVDNQVTEIDTEAVPPQILEQETIVNTPQTSNSSPISHGNGSIKVNIEENNNNDNNNDDQNNSGGNNNGGGEESDITPPVVTVTGTNPIDVTKDTLYTDRGATALDDVDGVIAVVTTGNADTSILGTYTLTYTATDSSGNVDTKTRTVNVVDVFVLDSTPPVITITGANPINVTKGTTYEDAGATANDAEDGVRTVTSSGTVDTATLGTYTITYTASDLLNNTATATRTINVVPDTTAPVITLLGNSTEVVAKNSVYTDRGATALDDVDGARAVDVAGVTDINTSIIATYTITYTATDLSGNTATATRTVIIDGGAKLNGPNFVTVSGNYAYITSTNSNSFEIVDISNPATLVHKSSVVDGVNGVLLSSPKAVAVSGNYAYVVSSGSNNLSVIDISNPLLPVIKSTLSNGDGGAQLVRPSSITISGNYAYIITSGFFNNIEIVDISNPTNPTHKSIYDFNTLTKPSSVFISGNYMYLTYTITVQGGGLQVVNISNPAAPAFEGAINNTDGGADLSYPRSVYVSGNYAYIASWDTKSLEVVDISNPNSPVHKGKLTTDFGGVNFTPNYIFVSDNYAYITSFVGETLEIVDISDPANPVHKGSMETNVGGSALSYPTSVFVSGDYAYISSSLSNALEIVDISDPTLPVHKNKILDGEFNHTDPIPRTEKQITAFNFSGLNPEVVGVVDETDHTISLTVPFDTNVTALVPTITISGGASVVPNSGAAQNFSNPITYTVTAENGSTQDYNVAVAVAPDSNSGPDNTPPSITSYTFNGAAQNITLNPTVENPLSLVLNASENVNWTSIKIEKEGDTGFYKYFYPGSNCDGGNTCTQDWDGLLTRGGLLQNGTYKVKVNFKDMAGNLYEGYPSPYYLLPYIITVDTSL